MKMDPARREELEATIRAKQERKRQLEKCREDVIAVIRRNGLDPQKCLEKGQELQKEQQQQQKK